MDSRMLLVTRSGSIDALYSLIQAEPCVLQNVDVFPFIHTPLHEASATGKINLAMELMILKPSFAKKLNEDGFSPLHLAVENHQVELALELVKFDPTLVRTHGRGGVTPLHLAVKKGNANLLVEFLQICPESIKDVNTNGETALHIAVINERYKEIKILRGWMQRLRKSDSSSSENHVLNRRDREGNTALHLAAEKNDHQAIKQLLKCMPLNLNIENKKGMTELDVLRTNGPHMSKIAEDIIQRSGGKSAASVPKVKTISEILTKRVTFKEYCSTAMARHRSNTSDGTRNALLVITALIITATYQAAVQPEEIEKGMSLNKLLTKIMVLWGFNTIAFFLAILLTFILLPVGRAYTWWYVSIMLPLFISYGCSVYHKYDIKGTNLLSLIKNAYFLVIIGSFVYLLIFYLKWKRLTRKKVSKPTIEMNSQVFKTQV